MKRWISRILILALLLTLLPAALAVPGAAEEYGRKRYNIMLVIDGSGSLVSQSDNKLPTDPHGMRYELLDHLMGALEDDGHNVGAIVFGGNNTADASDEAMANAIIMETDILSVDEVSPDGRPVKDYVMAKIRGAAPNQSKYSYNTDIGTAILHAERKLQEIQKQNELESLVFLFTDGESEARAREKSEQNRDTATYEMKQNDIRLFGAFLNAGRQSSSTNNEIIDIVCAANGITANSEEFLKSYVELQDADSCHRAVNVLLAFLGYLRDGPDPEPVVDDIEDTFVIPGIGVEEMNIRLYSYDGTDLPDLNVKLTRPDGSILSGSALNTLCRSGRTFRVYKLDDPMPGEWHLSIKVPEGNKVRYVYSPILSVFVDAQLSAVPSLADAHVGMDVSFQSTLAREGSQIADSSAYRGYSCSLEMMNKSTGEVQSFDVQPDMTNNFIFTLPIENYGEYLFRTVFSCGDTSPENPYKISVESPYLEAQFFNHEPETTNPPVQSVVYGWFQSNLTELDLTGYAKDLEDGTNLTFGIQDATCNSDGFALQGSTLQITDDKVGNGSITVVVTDTQGAQTTMEVRVVATSVTIWFIIAVIALILLIALILFMDRRKKNSHKPDGNLSVQFTCRAGGKKRTVNLQLELPGVMMESNTTLGKLIAEATRDEDRRIEGSIYARDVKDYLADMGLSADLNKIQVSATTTKYNGKTLGAILVRQGTAKHLLFNSSVTLDVGDHEQFTVEFEVNPDLLINPYGDNSGAGGRKDDFFGDEEEAPRRSRSGSASRRSSRKQAEDEDDGPF